MAQGMDPLAALEARIGYGFADRKLLTRALTHTSATSNPADSYQRLEFLGDRVLALSVAAMAYETYPRAEEGELARRLNALVKRETCAEIGRRLELGAVMRLGAGEAQTGGRNRTAILGDVTEALIAAIYLDGGFEPACAFVERHWRDMMMSARGPLRDAKTTLQEWVQGRGLPAPVYREVGRSGPDHDPEFTIAVDLAGLDGAEGRGRSKREAEQNAATAILVREGLWSEDGPIVAAPER
ncbi:ribonuclease III [Prosthecomicrobium hirschii]|uniref:ribonuclease III n=1 Tax=Prosthecodimorpha hirschii TaxID=665126 RepID=UPI00112ED971|nr:ribonuclease III [Prosthecomicrobium hirschii]TPQ52421.1 ribonuclease III [Prosthecomicrobium hirschii]